MNPSVVRGSRSGLTKLTIDRAGGVRVYTGAAFGPVGAREVLSVFLVRVVFCNLADDTGVFESRGIFLDDFIETWTG